MIDFNSEAVKPFADIWNKRPPSPMRQTKADWDKRADRWEEGLQQEGEFKESSDARTAATVAFLQSHGLLTPEQDVADVGCGPGRIATAFAQYVHHVTGTDLSDSMVRHAANYAAAQGRDNVDFVSCDFNAVDIDAMGWRNRFDLVFASITPAISTIRDIENMINMSRGWCFYAGFRSRSNDFEAQVARELYHMDAPMMKKDGKSSYGLLNMLWLSGYDPFVHFHYDTNQEQKRADEHYALQLAERMGFTVDDEHRIREILAYIEPFADEDGWIYSTHRESYAWLLWDTKHKRP